MAEAVKITLKRKRYTTQNARAREVLYNKSKRLFIYMTQAYVQALAVELGKHVDTGMSFGSIVPFARFVKAAEVDVPTPKRLSRKPAYDLEGNPITHSKKSLGTGYRAGAWNRAFKVLFGSAARPYFSMWFSIQVYQYLLHEYGYQTRAWNSLQKAEKAFHKAFKVYAKDVKKDKRNFVSPKDFHDVQVETIER